MVILRIQKLVLPAFLLFTVCCACFAYGVMVGRYKVYPYQVLRDARTAGQALIGARQPPENSGLTSYRDQVLVPTIRAHVPVEADELLLVCGGAGYRKDLHPAGCQAWLMDRQGQIKHFWNYDPVVWDKLDVVTRVPGVSGEISAAGMHVFDNGDLLVTYHGFNTFPFAVGMARFDKDSQLLWKKELLTHHSFSVAPDGRIFAPALRVVNSPLRLGMTATSITSDTGKIYSDFVLTLDSAGNVLNEISMLEALFASGWKGLLPRSNATEVSTDDPLHLNDVQLVGERIAAAQSWLAPDDMLVSFRNINTVGILDAQTQRFKWLSSGTTMGQHSPRLCDDGVLVLDNLGGDQRLGGTQLVKIDFARGLPTTLFPRDSTTMPDLCRTANSGHLEIHRDGRRAIMTISHSGALWEIDLQTGEVLWEFLYVHPHEDGARRGLCLAEYVYDPTFLHE